MPDIEQPPFFPGRLTSNDVSTFKVEKVEVLKLGQPLCEAFKLYSGPRGTGILTKPILKKFKCPDGGRGVPGGTGMLKLHIPSRVRLGTGWDVIWMHDGIG